MTSHRATRQARATLCLALLATVTSACGDCISIAYASLDIAVTIRKPGYETWIRTDVRVRDSGDCGHVRTTLLTAALTPVP